MYFISPFWIYLLIVTDRRGTAHFNVKKVNKQKINR